MKQSIGLVLMLALCGLVLAQGTVTAQTYQVQPPSSAPPNYTPPVNQPTQVAPVAPAPAAPLTLPDLVQKVKPAVAWVQVQTSRGMDAVRPS